MVLFHTSKIEWSTHTFFIGSDMFVLLKESLRIKAIKIICIDNDSENIIAYWKESKQNEALADKCDSFHTVNSWWVLGMGSAARGKTCNLFPHLCFETVLPALKLTQNCYLHYKHFFHKNWQLNHKLTPPLLRKCRTERWKSVLTMWQNMEVMVLRKSQFSNSLLN